MNSAIEVIAKAQSILALSLISILRMVISESSLVAVGVRVTLAPRPLARK